MNIKENLIANNVWWNGEGINSQFLMPKKRDEFGTIVKSLKEDKIVTIVGPRRVGKSSLIYQTINYLLINKKVSKKRILFINGDDPNIVFNEDYKLSNILKIYFSEILKEKVSKVTSKVYIFIDNIHFISNWKNCLKICLERKYNVKFIITSTAFSYLFKEDDKYLIDKVENVQVLPLTFSQFFNFHQVYISKKEEINIPKFDFNNVDVSFKKLERLYNDENFKLDIKKILNQYILVGGYVEYFKKRNMYVWQKYLLDDIMEIGIYKDILKVFPIKNPNVLEKLMYYISENNDQTFSYSGMTGNFNIDTATLINYISYLKQAGLINVLENYNSNNKKIVRSNKKISIFDTGIQNALVKRNRITSSDVEVIVKSIVESDIRLFCDKYKYNQFYYKNTKNEIDFIIDRNVDIIPIDVKYKNKINSSDITNISNFIEKDKRNVNYGIVVTRDLYKMENNIYFIPYWLFRF